jgi:hypothetical protein
VTGLGITLTIRYPTEDEKQEFMRQTDIPMSIFDIAQNMTPQEIISPANKDNGSSNLEPVHLGPAEIITSLNSRKPTTMATQIPATSPSMTGRAPIFPDIIGGRPASNVSNSSLDFFILFSLRILRHQVALY